MKQGLRSRLSVLFIGVVTSTMLIAGISLLVTTHHHFKLYQNQFGQDPNLPGLTYHLEQALFQSIIWTFTLTVLLAIFISLYAAKRLSAPLMEMKHAAEQMTHGKLDVRTVDAGNDEISDLGKALNHLAQQLQTQEQLRIAMTQDIAHELRTPLATLKSHIQAMLDQIWDPTPEHLRSCHEETERLIALVANLEQLTDMDSPHFQLDLKLEDLSSLIIQSKTIVTASFMQKNVGLKVTSLPHPNIQLPLDRDRFIQVLVNVLSNALKYTQEGGHVEIRALDEGNSVLIIIEDTGIGISPADLPYVFERFYRVDKSRNRKSGGGGIGLTIVKKLVNAHGGTVWIESEKGTKVSIRLPK